MNKHNFPALRRVSILTFIAAVGWPGILLYLLLIPALVSAQVPNFSWAKQAGGIGSDSCRGIAVDR